MASSTAQGPGPVQQDVCFHASLPGAKLLIVADGVGAFAGSDVIANVAVLTAGTIIKRLIMAGLTVSEAMLRFVIEEVQTATREQNAFLVTRGEETGGTTLLIGVETATYFYVASVGDGCVVFVDGARPPVGNLLSLTPMRDYIGSPSAQLTPAIMALPKTNPEGHCLFVATDGIATSIVGARAIASEMTTVRYLAQELQVTLEHAWAMADVQEVLDAWTQERARVEDLDGGGRAIDYSDDNRTVGVLIDDAYVRARRRHGDLALPRLERIDRPLRGAEA